MAEIKHKINWELRIENHSKRILIVRGLGFGNGGKTECVYHCPSTDQWVWSTPVEIQKRSNFVLMLCDEDAEIMESMFIAQQTRMPDGSHPGVSDAEAEAEADAEAEAEEAAYEEVIAQPAEDKKPEISDAFIGFGTSFGKIFLRPMVIGAIYDHPKMPQVLTESGVGDNATCALLLRNGDCVHLMCSAEDAFAVISKIANLIEE